jgi:hypothetical protein
MTDDNRVGPPSVEPLSDAAWSRIERGVWSRIEPAPAEPAPVRARRWWIAVVPAAAALALAAVAIGIRPPPAPGPDEPSRVVSGAAGSAVSFGDIHIELDAETALVMARGAGSPTIALERGAAWFAVAPRAQRPAVIVHAGDTAVRVIGTRFRVARSGEHSTVDVEHGVVEIEFRGHAQAVGAGQHWSSEAPDQASANPGAARSASGSPGATTEAPVAAAPGDPRTAPGLSPPEPAVAGPGAALAPTAPRPTATPRAATRSAAAPTGKPTADAAPGPGDRLDADRVEYDRLAALEPHAPSAALTGYLALANTSGRWADPALFAAARLAIDRGDRRGEALLERYLQQFPDGRNATDARQLLARVRREPAQPPLRTAP